MSDSGCSTSAFTLALIGVMMIVSIMDIEKAKNKDIEKAKKEVIVLIEENNGEIEKANEKIAELEQEIEILKRENVDPRFKLWEGFEGLPGLEESDVRDTDMGRVRHMQEQGCWTYKPDEDS